MKYSTSSEVWSRLDKVCRDVITWVGQGCVPEKTEFRGKAREVLVTRSMFDPEIFKMKEGVLISPRQLTRPERRGMADMPPESMITEVWCLCHQSNLGGHRSLEGTLSNLLKLVKGFFLLSARQKIPFLNGGCDTCLTKE